MPRIKLTAEEREARRKERSRLSFSNAAYKHYDALKEGFGSASEWIAAAEALANGHLIVGFKLNKNADLELLMLDEMPATMAKLKTAYRNSLFIYHPDHGGTDAQAIAARDAFERLAKHYK